MIEEYWQQFINTHPQYKNKTYYSFAFCGEGHPQADEIAQLVVNGIKTATSSLFQLYEIEQHPLPQVGDISIVLNGQGKPICIIENQAVSIIPYYQMNDTHAFKEGENDRSYRYWKKEHDHFFTNELAQYQLPLTHDVLVCFEEFIVIYK